MYVPCNPAAAQRPARLPLAAAVVAMFASVVGVAHAVEFDEKVKAPLAKNMEQLRLAAHDAGLEASAGSADARAAALRDPAKSRKHFDARWTMLHAVETRAPLGDLSEFGLVPSADGQVRIDLEKYPQWDSFESRIVSMLTTLQLATLGVDLMNRGMHEADVAALKAYVAAHDAAAMSRRAALPVAVSFSRVVRKYDRIKRAVPDELVFNYFYQRDAATLESDRAWTAGLLDSLDPQAARVLLSYFDELETTAVWGPSDYEAGIRSTLANLRLPDFEQRAQAEALGGAK
jgi:hypothetical protein